MIEHILWICIGVALGVVLHAFIECIIGSCFTMRLWQYPRMKIALEWYAIKYNYQERQVCTGHGDYTLEPPRVLQDEGCKARLALMEDF